MVYIIVKGKEQERSRLKGKTVTEFAKNLESEGYPMEFDSREQEDRLKFIEKKKGRPLQYSDFICDGRPTLVKKLEEGNKKGLVPVVEKVRGVNEPTKSKS